MLAQAVSVFTKPGFTEEGRLRHEFFDDGEYSDVLRMAIFQPEYLRRSKELATA